LYAGLGSNRDKKEDAIDRSVIQHYDKVFGPKGLEIEKEYTKIRSVGFNPIYKRVVWVYSHATKGTVTIAKCLSTKVLDTADHGVDDAADQWKCEGYQELEEVVKKTDYDFSKAGYKTLGVAVKFNDGPYKFVGILPMLDPPRHDSAQTVKNLKAAGIKVKMITGDHLNIAKETCRLIGMGQNIHPGEATRNPTHDTHELIWNADGFAQVLPKDKREVVLVLKETYKQIVGMTGDGVNDAPALSAAQCGVAVDDATDAAKNAAAIILTTPGLSAIYQVVVESRRIFRKLKSYVTYRFAASMQIVIVLTLLIYISECAIFPLFIILLALFNDLTMLPIAYDLQCASKQPEVPDVGRMLIISLFFGSLETFFTLIFAYGGKASGVFSSNTNFDVNHCGIATQSLIWIQMFVATELLIFSARAPTYLWMYLRPHYALIVSISIGCTILCLLSSFAPGFGDVPSNDIGVTWLYNFIVLVIVDVLKVQLFNFLGEVQEVIVEVPGEHGAAPAGHGEHGHGEEPVVSKGEAAAERASEYAATKSDRLSQASPNYKPMSGSGRASEAAAGLAARDNGRGSISARQLSQPGSGDARGGVVGGNIRPNVPQNRTVKR